jgi:predicted alpha/beta-fold hydrolase
MLGWLCAPPKSACTHVAQRSERNELLLEAMPAARSYRPPLGYASPHAQIVATSVFRERPHIAFEREPMALADGGSIALDWLPGVPAPGTPVLIILHGLTGGSQETYVRWMALKAQSQGYAVCVMNARGCSRQHLASPKTFSAAWTEDIRTTALRVRTIVGPATPVFAVGYSLGAGILTKFVCEDGSACELDGAVAVCASFDLSVSTTKLEQGLNSVLYNPVLAGSLRAYFDRHKHHFAAGAAGEGKVDVAAACNARTVRAFDAATIVPLFGYEDTAAYYSDGTTAGRIHEIGIPFLALSAEDDPICAIQGLPRAAFEANPNTLAIITPTGGHVAWVMRSGSRITYSWENRVVMEFTAALTQLFLDWSALFPARAARIARAGAKARHPSA